MNQVAIWWLCAVSVAVATVIGLWSVRERRPAPGECRDGHRGWCRAFRWPHCSDGRCKKHCDLWCKCVPVGHAGELRIIDGGRSGGKGA